jgi:hypothetical protein
MTRSALPNALPRRSFLSAVDCPHCSRGYFIEGTAPIDEGHQPHYFACECGRKVMAVVPRGAEVATAHLVRSPQPATKTG